MIDAPAHIGTRHREEVANETVALEALGLKVLGRFKVGRNALALVLGVKLRQRTQILEQENRTVMDQIGKDLCRVGATVLDEVVIHAGGPLVVGAAEVVSEIGEISGFGRLVLDELRRSLQATDTLFAVRGRQFHVMDETVGVFEKF